MREIKFRAFLRSDQRLPNGITLGYEKYPKGVYEVMELNFANETATLWSEKEQTCFEVSFRKIELMQYTGEVDQNGIEICEGDVVISYDTDALPGDKGIIVFQEGALGFLSDEKEFFPFTDTPAGSMDIVGNIYKNPGFLLEKRK